MHLKPVAMKPHMDIEKYMCLCICQERLGCTAVPLPKPQCSKINKGLVLVHTICP